MSSHSVQVELYFIRIMQVKSRFDVTQTQNILRVIKQCLMFYFTVSLYSFDNIKPSTLRQLYESRHLKSKNVFIQYHRSIKDRSDAERQTRFLHIDT